MVNLQYRGPQTTPIKLFCGSAQSFQFTENSLCITAVRTEVFQVMMPTTTLSNLELSGVMGVLSSTNMESRQFVLRLTYRYVTNSETNFLAPTGAKGVKSQFSSKSNLIKDKIPVLVLDIVERQMPLHLVFQARKNVQLNFSTFSGSKVFKY